MSDTGTYILRGLPRDLWRRVKARASREGHTIRFVVMKFLASYAKNEKL